MRLSCRPRSFLILAIAASLVLAAACGLALIGPSLPLLAEPAVAEIVPWDGASDILPSSPVTLTFASPMDRAATKAAISSAPLVRMSFHWADDRTLVLAPQAGWPLSTTVSIRVSMAARSRAWRSPAHEFVTRFTTIGPPRVSSSQPATNAAFAYEGSGLSITFNREMDKPSVEPRLNVSPPIEGQQMEWQGLTLRVSGVMKPGVTYHATLAAGTKDTVSGLATERPIEWTFTAGSQYSLLAPARPGLYTVVAAGQPVSFPTQLANVSLVEARLYALKPDAYWKVARLAAEAPGSVVPPADPPLRSWSTNPRFPLDRYSEFALPLGSLDRGLYLLVLDSPETDPINQVIVASDIDLTVKRGDDSLLVWATRRGDGSPVASLPISLNDALGVQLEAGQTNEQGLYLAHQAASREPVFALASAAAGFALVSTDWQDGIEPWRWQDDMAQQAASEAAKGTGATEQVSVRFDRAAYASGDKMRVTVEAPGMKGERVDWRLDAQDEPSAGGEEGPAPNHLREVTAGTGVLDANGRLALTIPASLAEGEMAQRYSLEALIERDGGEPASGAASVLLQPAALSIAARPAKRVLAKGEANSFLIQTLDLDGNAFGKTRLDYALKRVTWDCSGTDKQAGTSQTFCAEKDETVGAGQLTTDASGSYQLPFIPTSGGTCRLELAGHDAAGRRAAVQAQLWVSAPDEQVPWKVAENHLLTLHADALDYTPGQVARILLESPFTSGWALLAAERGGILWQQVIQVRSNSALLEIPIQDSFAPFVDIGVVLMPPQASGAIRVGYARLQITGSTADGAGAGQGPARTASSRTLTTGE